MTSFLMFLLKLNSITYTHSWWGRLNDLGEGGGSMIFWGGEGEGVYNLMTLHEVK